LTCEEGASHQKNQGDAVAYWVKILYDRKTYIINFDNVNAFCCEQNGRITFWLPDSAIPIVLTPQAHLEDYEKLQQYLQYVSGLEIENSYWVKINYQQRDYVINLTTISSFCQEPNGRITFWLPDGSIPIIIHPLGNPEAHKKVLKFVESFTGHCL
jgi:hypothetical protein